MPGDRVGKKTGRNFDIPTSGCCCVFMHKKIVCK